MNEAFWNRIWSDSGLPPWGPMEDEILAELRREIPSIERASILDAGSGSGRISARLAEAGAQLTLIDSAPAALDMARKILAASGLSAEVRQGDIRTLPFPDRTFDVIWNAGVLEHYSEEGQVAILRQFRRVLRPGGRILTFNPYARCLFYRLGMWQMQRSGQWDIAEEPVHTLRLAGEAAGLCLVAERPLAFETGLYFLEFVIPGARAAASRVMEWYTSATPEVRAAFPGYLLLSVLEVA